MTEEKGESQADSGKVLEVMRQRFSLVADGESEIRRLMLEDKEFRAGEQWPEQIKRERDIDGRPCLTINRMPQMVQQVTNDQRQNRPSIKVRPVDDEADVETAKIFQGLIRHIEQNSNADVAYDTAFDNAVGEGRGFFRILTDYVDAMSFEQEILIKRIRNAFSVYLDPHYQEPDGSDANWGFIFDEIPKDDFKAQYPNAELCRMDDWTSIGDRVSGWIKKDIVRVAEYFYRENVPVTLVRMSDGSVGDKAKLPEMLPPGIEIVDERKTLVPVIKWVKTNGLEILSETVWPSKWIPIIPVLGNELDIEGKQVLEGIIRHAKDPQRMYNFWTSSETETIALAPRAPYVGAEGQFEGHEDKWASANRKNIPFLEYVPVSIGGQPVGAPQRNVYEPPVQAITQAKMLSSEDIKSTTGIYDASLGNRSNETSGKAINARKTQTQTSNFHFTDNLSRSMRHAGRIIVDLIPKVYDTPRAARIIGEEGDEQIVRINEEFEKQGETVRYDMTRGKYDVVIDTGPSYATKRQEAAEGTLALAGSNPKVMDAAGDLIVKSLDIPLAHEISERLKKMLPPGLAADDKEKKPLPPEAQAQMQQMDQMIQQLTEKLNEANDDIRTKRMELESKERIEMAKLQVQIEIEMAKMGSVESLALLKAEVAQIENRLNLLNQNVPIQTESNGAGPEGAAMPDQNQQPTGGPSPGLPMGV